MKLYFDNLNNEFSLKETETNECVFETYERDERIGWKAGTNPIIKKGPFEILIGTNFYPKAPHREYISIIITVNGIRLLPLSMAVRKADVYYQFSKKDLTINQYGIKNYSERNPATIVQIGDSINWGKALEEICWICNNYKEWILKESGLLIAKLCETICTSHITISSLLELVRVYDELIPEIIPIYRKFADLYCLDALRSVIDFIGRTCENNTRLNHNDKEAKAMSGDIIWQYIKDYYLN